MTHLRDQDSHYSHGWRLSSLWSAMAIVCGLLLLSDTLIRINALRPKTASMSAIGRSLSEDGPLEVRELVNSQSNSLILVFFSATCPACVSDSQHWPRLFRQSAEYVTPIFISVQRTGGKDFLSNLGLFDHTLIENGSGIAEDLQIPLTPAYVYVDSTLTIRKIGRTVEDLTELVGGSRL